MSLSTDYNPILFDIEETERVGDIHNEDKYDYRRAEWKQFDKRRIRPMVEDITNEETQERWTEESRSRRKK